MKKAIGCQTKTNGTVLAALGAGSVCNLITNPLSVVRARMLLSDKTSTGKGSYDTLGQTLVHIAKTEGISGFYKVCAILHDEYLVSIMPYRTCVSIYRYSQF